MHHPQQHDDNELRYRVRVVIPHLILGVDKNNYDQLQQVHELSEFDTISILKAKIVTSLTISKLLSPEKLFWLRIVFQFNSWPSAQGFGGSKILLPIINANEKQKQDRLFSIQLRKNNARIKMANSVDNIPSRYHNPNFQRRFYVPFEHENVLALIKREEQHCFCRGVILLCVTDVRSLWNSRFQSENNFGLLKVPAVLKSSESTTLPLNSVILSLPLSPINCNANHFGAGGSFLQISIDGCAMAQLLPSLSLQSLASPNPTNTATPAHMAFTLQQLSQIAVDSFFWEISNTSIIQGQLLRRVLIGSKAQESWRPLYFIFEREQKPSRRERRLWFFSNQVTKEVCPPSFLLISDGGKRRTGVSIEISEKDPSLLVLRGCRDSWSRGFEGTWTDVDTIDLSGTVEPIILKAKCASDALAWYTHLGQAIGQNTSGKIAGSAEGKFNSSAAVGIDNDLLIAMEHQIAASQSQQTDSEVEAVQSLKTLRGALKDRLFRRGFRSFLRSRRPCHWLLLLLFEQCSDFLCAQAEGPIKDYHPYRIWARRLCAAFLSDRVTDDLAPYVEAEGRSNNIDAGYLVREACEALLVVREDLISLRDFLTNLEKIEEKTLNFEVQQGEAKDAIVSSSETQIAIETSIQELKRKCYQHLQRTVFTEYLISPDARSQAIARAQTANRTKIKIVESSKAKVIESTNAPAASQRWGLLGRLKSFSSNSTSSSTSTPNATKGSRSAPTMPAESSVFTANFPWRINVLFINVKSVAKGEVTTFSEKIHESSRVLNRGWSTSLPFIKSNQQQTQVASEAQKIQAGSKIESKMWDLSVELPDDCWDQIANVIDFEEAEPISIPNWFPQEEVSDPITEIVVTANSELIHTDLLLERHKQQIRNGQVNSNIYVEAVELTTGSPSSARKEPAFLSQLRAFKLQSVADTPTGRQPADFLQLLPMAGLGQVLFAGTMKCRSFATNTHPKALSSRRRLLSANGNVATSAGPLSSPISTGATSSFNPECEQPTNVSILQDIVSRYVCDLPISPPSIQTAYIPPASAAASCSSTPALSSSPSMRLKVQDETTSVSKVTSPTSSSATSFAVEASRNLCLFTACMGSLKLHMFSIPAIAISSSGIPEQFETSSSFSGHCSLDISSALRITPSPQQLHAFDICFPSGITWRFCPEGVDEEDSKIIAAKWMDTFSVYCLPTTDVILLLRSGYLLKRGDYNTAFKSRWFVLSSDYKLRYYTDDGGVFKGEIDLRLVDRSHSNDRNRSLNYSSAYGKSIVLSQKDIVISMQKRLGRLWRLQANDEAEAASWVAIINQLLRAREQSSSQLLQQGLRSMDGDFSDIDEDSIADDDDQLSRSRTESNISLAATELEESSAKAAAELSRQEEEAESQPQLSEFIIGDSTDERYSTF